MIAQSSKFGINFDPMAFSKKKREPNRKPQQTTVRNYEKLVSAEKRKSLFGSEDTTHPFSSLTAEVGYYWYLYPQSGEVSSLLNGSESWVQCTRGSNPLLCYLGGLDRFGSLWLRLSELPLSERETRALVGVRLIRGALVFNSLYLA